MASQHESGTKTTDGTEQTLNTTSPDLTDGVFQLYVELVNMVNGDAIELRIKEKATATGDTIRVAWSATYANAQGTDGALVVSPPLVLTHGWDMTIKRTAGTDRSYKWSIRKAG